MTTVSIRSILRNAIESGDASSLGELLATNGFAEVESAQIGEALLHYADAAPLDHAEALHPAVTSYHSHTHGLEVDDDGITVDSSFSLPAVIAADEADLEQEVSGSAEPTVNSVDLDDLEPGGIADAGMAGDALDDIDELDDSGFDIDDIDGPLANAGIQDTSPPLSDVGVSEAAVFGVGSTETATSLTDGQELDAWTTSVDEIDDIDDVPFEAIAQTPEVPASPSLPVEDPADLDFDDDLLDFD